MKHLFALLTLVATISLFGCGDGKLPQLKAPQLVGPDVSIGIQRDGRDAHFEPTPYFHTLPGVRGFGWWKVVRLSDRSPFMVQITPEQRDMLTELMMRDEKFTVTLLDARHQVSLTQPGTGNVMLFLKEVVPVE